MEEEGEGLGEEQEPATGISSSQPQDRPEAEAAEATAAAPGSPAGPAAGGAAAAVPQSPGTLKNCYKQGGSLVVQVRSRMSNPGPHPAWARHAWAGQTGRPALCTLLAGARPLSPAASLASLAVQLALQGSNVYLGSFKGPEAAGMARDVACICESPLCGVRL